MSERLRVLRAITRLNIGGPARQATLMHRELPRRGLEAHLLVGAEDPREGRVDPGPNRVTTVPELHRRIDPIADVRAFRQIDRFISSWQPDVVHSHMAKAGALTRTAAHRREVPAIVHTFHGHVLEGYFPAPIARAFVAAECKLAKRTHALLAVAPEIRDELLDLGIGRPTQWHVIPVGVELDALSSSSVTPSKARRILGLPDRPTVGIVGRLVAIKDHDMFLEVAAAVARAIPDVTFVLAGDGDRRIELETKAGSLGDQVRFLGWVTDLPVLYAALDIVVLTSRNEGTPFSLIEAAAAGRPVVATNVGGVREVVIGGKTGILAPPGDTPAIAAAILSLLREPERAAAYGAAARPFVLERFSAAALVDNLVALYGDLVGASRR